MASSPPGVKRIVSVLNFFAEHPGQAFTFTDVVRALKLGRATCHALLSGLVEAGYLYRNLDKTYVIGPTLVDLGRVVSGAFSPLQAIEPELRKLADDAGAMASAIAHEGGEVVILAKAGTGSSFAWANSPVGNRLPLRVPYNCTYFARSDRAELEQWLEDFGGSPSDEQLALMHEGVEFVRTHGFVCMVSNSKLSAPPTVQALSWLSSDSELPATLLTEIDPQNTYESVSIVAPIFDRQGRAPLVLALTGFARPLSGEKILELGLALTEASARITYFIGGKRLS